MDLWMKIGSALLLIMMAIYIWPAARHWLKNGPKGSYAQWMNVIFIFGLVALFVLLLMKMV
jgi:uncharacterized membrane protein YphA (DoxX/SURF4 family)